MVLNQMETRPRIAPGEVPAQPLYANEEYTVGWICAITPEQVAARAFFDEKHDGPEYVPPGDKNTYTLGRIGKHNVVVAILPEGSYGVVAAANVASDMLRSFPNIRFGLMVGIGGGAPSRKHDIRLGDIVVSTPQNGIGGVFPFDFGKTIQNQKFLPTGFLNRPPALLLSAVTSLKAKYEAEGHQLDDAVNGLLEAVPRLKTKYKRPDARSDKLYQSGVIHPPDEESGCAAACGTDPSNLVLRRQRTEDEDNPAIHYGLIASANQLMKDALLRDSLAEEKDILCFEMEAAGLMNHFPCLVIRGICDYSDTHKTKEWQGYAAMIAAAYARDLLSQIVPERINDEKRIVDLLPG
jgi:nucleoside phosphorylase